MLQAQDLLMHLDLVLNTTLVGEIASLASTLTIDPASWSLDNFGQKLIATIKNGKTFEWNPINSNPNALTTRATVVSGAPQDQLCLLCQIEIDIYYAWN